jgi:hypothetical protein
MVHHEPSCIEPRIGALRRRDVVALVATTLALGSVKSVAEVSTRRPLIAVLLGGAHGCDSPGHSMPRLREICRPGKGMGA